MIWLVSLILTSCVGVWLAVDHWYGWALCTASEALWLAYAITLHAMPLAIMSIIWFAINGRNTLHAFRRSSSSGESTPPLTSQPDAKR